MTLAIKEHSECVAGRNSNAAADCPTALCLMRTGPAPQKRAVEQKLWRNDGNDICRELAKSVDAENERTGNGSKIRNYLELIE